MIVYQCDASGFLVSSIELNDSDRDPMDTSVFLIPGGCVTEVPPLARAGFLLKWVNGGWVYEPAPISLNTESESGAGPELARPAVCTPWQIRKALNLLGLRAQVETAVAAADQDVRDGWEFATVFRSDDPLALAIGAALGKSPDEVREIIANAATL